MTNNTLYINGYPHKIRRIGGAHIGRVFFVDHPDHPGVACAAHTLNDSALAHMKAGGAVFTGGNRYSFQPGEGK